MYIILYYINDSPCNLVPRVSLWRRTLGTGCFVLPCCYTRASRNDGRPKLTEELNRFVLGQVIHRADNVVYRINHYPAASVVCSASSR